MQAVFLTRGLGEYAQGYALASTLVSAGHRVHFLAEHEFLGKIVRNDGFALTKISKSNVAEILDSFTSDVLVLCNSHTTTYYDLKRRPQKIKLVCSLDSNWLFNNRLYQRLRIAKFYTYEWIDRIYVVFPQKLFLSNLKENGGYYTIEGKFLAKIETVGFIPSGITLTPNQKKKIRNKHGIGENDKFIVCYFSKKQFHGTKIKDYIDIFEQIVFEACGELSKNGRQIKVLNLSTMRANFPARANNILSSSEFDQILSIANGMVMHMGYGTLPKLFRNGVPVICFVPEPESAYFSSFYELKPCLNLGMAESLLFSQVNKTTVMDRIQQLLFNERYRQEMIKNQTENFASGEEVVLADLLKALG